VGECGVMISQAYVLHSRPEQIFPVTVYTLSESKKKRTQTFFIIKPIFHTIVQRSVLGIVGSLMTDLLQISAQYSSEEILTIASVNT